MSVPPCEGGGCHLHPPITGMSPGHVQPPALPAHPPAAGTSHQLFLALQRCALPAMAPCITIIAGCQHLEAGSQDRGGAATPLVTRHLVPAGSALQQAISGNPMRWAEGAQATRSAPELDPGSSWHCSDPHFTFIRDSNKGQESPLAPDPNFWPSGIRGFGSACQRDGNICKTWI